MCVSVRPESEAWLLLKTYVAMRFNNDNMHYVHRHIRTHVYCIFSTNIYVLYKTNLININLIECKVQETIAIQRNCFCGHWFVFRPYMKLEYKR